MKKDKKHKSQIIFYKRDNFIYKLIIFVFGFILYSNTLENTYALDDKAVIWKNKFTQKGIAGIKEIFSYDSMAGLFGTEANLEGGRYRPLSLVTFAIEIEFFGKKMTNISATEPFKGCPFVSHLVNILLYCTTLLILYKVLKKLFINFKPKYEFLSIPFLATILFAAHPLHTEIVANIKGRDEILAFLFSFEALNYAIKYIDKNKRSPIYKLIGIFICIFLGAMAKETTITFLAIIPLCIYFFRDKQKISNYILILVPAIIGILLYFILRYKAIGNTMGLEVTNLMNNPFYGMTILQRYSTIFFTLLLYLKLLIFPHPLTWDYYPYHIGIYEVTNIWVILSLLLHLAFFAIAILGLKKKSVFSFSILFYMITLSITSNLIFNIGAFMNERFIYFSLLGFCIVVAYLLSEKLPKILKNIKIYKISSTLVLSIILILFSIKVVSRNRNWENSYTLFKNDVAISKNSAKGNSSYASELYKQADDADALEIKDTVLRNKLLLEAKPYFEKSIEIYPQFDEPLLSLGNVYYRVYNDYKTMFKFYIKILESNPLNRDVWNNTVGVLTQNLNEPEYEKQIWKKYTELSDYYESFKQLGNLYKDENKNDSAIYYYEEALKRNPKNFELLYNLGDVYGKVNNFEKAREYFLQALTIKQDANVYKFIGLSYGLQNNNQKALEYFEKGLQIDPQNVELQKNVMIARKILQNN